MSAKELEALREIPTEELKRRMARLKKGRMFWRYYFEITIREIRKRLDE